MFCFASNGLLPEESVEITWKMIDRPQGPAEMISVKVEITRFVDDGQPGWVECKLVDAYGREHLFLEKVPVVSLEDLDGSSAYPLPGLIGCEVIERKLIDGVEIVTINSAMPWSIESVDGEEVFCVRSDQLKDS